MNFYQNINFYQNMNFCKTDLLAESPVEQRRKELLQGDCNWLGYDAVYTNLQKAAEKLSSGKYTRLSGNHIETMAVMACGHEETMKSWQMVCRNNNWI